MTKEIVQNSTDIVTNNEKLRVFLQASTSENTRRSYRSAIRQFERWGGMLPCNASILVQYIVSRSQELSPQTLSLHLTAIKQWHVYQGIHDPTADPLIRKTMEGIRRVTGKPQVKAQALRLEHIAQMVACLKRRDESKKQFRDLALILIGYFGAFRRSELVGISVEDLTFEPEGVLIRLPKSKTDQTGSGIVKAIPYSGKAICPVKSLEQWLHCAGISEGSVFCSVNRWDQIQPRALIPSAVNDLLKSIGRECEFDFVPNLSSHSLRRGMSTSAARENISFELIKKQGGWKNDATVWEYIDEGRQFTDNASGQLMDVLNEISVKD
ncbi:site-specific integrase [Sessilibacter corallicola]|uniref:Site-specific integrase n=1 Tax=Sessilibacter corallicola TaxID=2904075 RepID=A0ABQ0AEE3_9GAMM